MLGQQALKLKTKDDELKTKDDQLATRDDIIQQLELQNSELELAYNKLWRERFEARSERYIATRISCVWTLATPPMRLRG